VKQIIGARGVLPDDSRSVLRALADLLSRCLSQSAAERPASARDFLAQLEFDARRRTRAIATAGIGVLFAAVGGVAGVEIGPRSTPLSEARYAVVTLRPQDSTDAQAVREVSSRLADWKGPIVADLDPTRDAQDRPSLENTLKASRRARVRNLVVVSANQDRDS